MKAFLTDEEAGRVVVPEFVPKVRVWPPKFINPYHAMQHYLLAMGHKRVGDVRWNCGCTSIHSPCERHRMAVRDYVPTVIRETSTGRMTSHKHVPKGR